MDGEGSTRRTGPPLLALAAMAVSAIGVVMFLGLLVTAPEPFEAIGPSARPPANLSFVTNEPAPVDGDDALCLTVTQLGAYRVIDPGRQVIADRVDDDTVRLLVRDAVVGEHELVIVETGEPIRRADIDFDRWVAQVGQLGRSPHHAVSHGPSGCGPLDHDVRPDVVAV